jgi:hypothetical protein
MLLQELRQGSRALLRVPSLTTISILTVALGVGAGASLFGISPAEAPAITVLQTFTTSAASSGAGTFIGKMPAS